MKKRIVELYEVKARHGVAMRNSSIILYIREESLKFLLDHVFVYPNNEIVYYCTESEVNYFPKVIQEKRQIYKITSNKNPKVEHAWKLDMENLEASTYKYFIDNYFFPDMDTDGIMFDITNNPVLVSQKNHDMGYVYAVFFDYISFTKKKLELEIEKKIDQCRIINKKMYDTIISLNKGGEE